MLHLRFMVLTGHQIIKSNLRVFSTSTALLNRIASTSLEKDRLKVQWQNGEKSEFHNVWLRDHCRCEKCFNYSTYQREYDMLHMPLDIKPTQATSSGEQLHLTWPDGHTTVYNAEWLQNHEYKTRPSIRKGTLVEPFLWNKQRITSVDLPQVTYQSVLEDDKDCFKASFSIEKFGFVFVHDIPTELVAIENLAKRLAGFVRETHFGAVWEFSNKAMDHADTAFTSARLEAHNDNTYFTDPCGLQLLHCIQHDGSGGESLLVDGFNAAEMLKKKDPEAFTFLSSQKIPAIYEDKSLCFKSDVSVIEHDPYWKNVKQIRFNMYDRDVLDCLDAEDVPKFYHAYQAMAKVIRDPVNEFWFKLQPGVVMVMANWRVLHGRNSFTGNRTLQGCYCSKDDFQAQFRPKLKTYENELD